MTVTPTRPLSVCLGLVTLLLQVSCATGEPTGDRPDGGDDPIRLSQSMDPAHQAPTSAGTLADNGLEVRKWIVADDARAIGETLLAHGEPVPLSPVATATLARNGFRLWRIPGTAVMDLESGFGGSTVDQQWWHGQVLEWRELHPRSLGSLTRGVALGGNVRTFRGGTFSLMMRTWTVQTEVGPRMQFEMVPLYIEHDPGGFRRALKQDDAGEVFPSLLLQTALESGYVYVLTCERPDVDWNRMGRSTTGSGRDRLAIPDGGGVRGNVGPPGPFGPEIEGPWTVGEALLRGVLEAGTRGVILLIPRIPDRFFPEEMLAGTMGGRFAPDAGHGDVNGSGE